MKRGLAIIIITSIVSFGCVRSIELTGDLSEDCDKLLKSGSYTVKIYENATSNDIRYDEINEKMSRSISENLEWFAEYTLNNDKPLPYHKKFGITEAEYTYFLNYSNKNFDLIQTGEENLVITNEGEDVTFVGTGDLRFMRKLKFNTNDSTIAFIGNVLEFDSFFIVDNTDNIYKSKWKGYSWSFYENVSVENLVNTTDMKYYSVTIGYLEDKQERLLIIEGRQIEEGEIVVDFNANMILVKN
jgi:hypothetical protein